MSARKEVKNDVAGILKRLGIDSINPGAWSGSLGWSKDFAVGQSRMLYGSTMHSERPQHRMYEQWHPLGVVGIISAFNFPVAVWAWNAFLAAICGNACIWKPSPKTPLTALAVQHICNRVMEVIKLPPIFQIFIDGG